MTKEFMMTFIAIFVALDVIGMLPMYLSMTQSLAETDRSRIANTSMWVALGVAIVFTLVGKLIFQFLGIEVYDFKIAGGLILLLASLADLLGGPGAMHQSSGSTGIVPLAVPLITGPAILTTVIFQVSSVGYAITLSALILNYAIAWFCLRKSQLITRFIGKDGTVVISKLAALLLAAIAISMVRSGVSDSIRSYTP